MCLRPAGSFKVPSWGAGGISQQRGFLLPLSLFLVIAAASLVLAINQMVAGSRSSAVLAALNAQALYSAEAGMQSALSQLYFDASTQAEVDTRCASVDGMSRTCDFSAC